MSQPSHRTETDTLGPIEVPSDRYWGAQTQRSLQNFKIGGERMPTPLIRAFGLLKQAAAEANMTLGKLDKKVGKAIAAAAAEVATGQLDDHFPLVVWQTGSGTQTNMNLNEVIANRANEMLGGKRGDKKPVHPNDQVNYGQSSNDSFPTAMHIAAAQQVHDLVLPALDHLAKALEHKAKEFTKVIKIGRTHLQDATPVRLGQEFGGYARQIELGIARMKRAQAALSEVALGGTAVGTGLNCHPKFAGKVMALISKETGCSFKEAVNHFEGQSAQDSLVEASGELRTLAVSLMKIANDIRWLGSGPRCGLGEINLPETQPGSSIMPGKVNPVIAESVTMVCAQVIGNDVTITVGGQAANFELIVMLPVMAYNLLQSIELLSTASTNFAVKCIAGIKANEERCKSLIEESLAMCTALAPVIGYEAAAKLAKDAYKSGKTVREVAREQNVLPEKRLNQLLDPWRMTQAGGPVGSAGG